MHGQGGEEAISRRVSRRASHFGDTSHRRRESGWRLTFWLQTYKDTMPHVLKLAFLIFRTCLPYVG